MTASESAYAFAELSAREKDTKIAETRAMLARKCGNSYLRSTIQYFADALLESGRVEHFEALGNDFWSLWKLWQEGVNIDTCFALFDLEPNLIPMRMESVRKREFRHFEQAYARLTQIFQSAGSDEFIESLYKFTFKYGGKLGKSGEPVKGSKCDLYLPYAAVILMRKHGEEKVISVIDRMTKEGPVPILDFIRLVETDRDLTEVPLAWAAQIAGGNE